MPYMGFDRLKQALEFRGKSKGKRKKGKGKVKDAGALAAWIGRKKYGKARFQRAAATGKKLRG